MTYVHPFLLSHEDEIDATWTKAKGQAKAAGLDYMRRAWLAVREAVMGAILAVSGCTAPLYFTSLTRMTRQPDDRQAAAALTGTAPSRPTGAPVSTPKTDNPAPPSQQQQPTQRPAPTSPSQQAWAFAGSMLRNYGPAALAAGHAVLHPLQSQSQSQSQSGTRTGGVLNEDAKRKKYDDLAASGISNRTYAQEMPRASGVAGEGGKRAVSAAAALMGGGAGTQAQGQASSSAYSGYTRAQLRQRRLELERELASLETPIASRTVSHVYNEQDESPAGDMDSLRPYPPTSSSSAVRSRHISAPTPPRYPSASSPASASRPSSSSSVNLAAGSGAVNSGLEASLYEQIRREDIDNVSLPKDWGTRAQKQGWKGAPPTPSSGNSVHTVDSSPSASASSTVGKEAEERPALPPKRSSWFWNSGSAAPAGQKKKD